MGTADPFLGKLHVVSAVGNAVFGISDSGRGVVGISNTGYGVYGVSNFNEAGHFEGSVGITNKLSFGATTRQMINLWDTAYGIGVQGSTQYFRSFSHFGWYRGGVHHDAELNPGRAG